MIETFKFWRDKNGAHTNVPWLVSYHSPTGHCEWGYSGSGPADLALNILEYILREDGFDGPVSKCGAFELAFSLHQEFKWGFIANADREGFELSVKDVTHWLLMKTDYQRWSRREAGFSDEEWL